MNLEHTSAFSHRASTLESADARFLSLNLGYALEADWLTPGDLCDEFPPEQLMMALQQAPELRAQILVDATGVHERVAMRKSTGAAAEDLRLALDEGLCDADRLLEIISVDDWVRYLDASRLWALLTRDQFWLDNGPRAQKRVAYMLQVSLEQHLLELPALLRAITPERLAQDFPRELVELVMVSALNQGLDNQLLEPERFADLIPLGTWLEHVPLVHIWESVIGEVVVPRAGLAPRAAAPSPAPVATPSPAPAPVKAAPAKKGAQTVGRIKKAAAPVAASSFMKEPARAAMSAEERKARSRALHLLTRLERKPEGAEKLSTPALLGLETMYTELPKTTSNEEKEECILDAFPNEHLLEEALLPVTVMLDPRLSEEELLRRGADAGSLVALVLFEERRRVNRSQSIPPAAPQVALPAPSVPPASAYPASMPPIPGSPPAARLADSVPPPPISGVSHQAASSAPPPPSRRVSSLPPPLPRQARPRSH